MSTYLFITGTEHTPEEVEFASAYWWSCSSTTKSGDDALAYVKGRGIEYEWKVVSDAIPDPKWKFIADMQYVRQIAPPITLNEIRAATTRNQWSHHSRIFGGEITQDP